MRLSTITVLATARRPSRISCPTSSSYPDNTTCQHAFHIHTHVLRDRRTTTRSTPRWHRRRGRVCNARKNPQLNVDTQLTWLSNILRSAPSRYRFVITCHHNMYSASVVVHQGDTGVASSLEPILAPYATRVVAYLAGHEHSLMHMQPYATQWAHYYHYLSGAGSKVRPLVPLPVERARHWLSCCNVLAMSANASAPRTVSSEIVYGFFAFSVYGDRFTATAYDDRVVVLHHHERTLVPAVVA